MRKGVIGLALAMLAGLVVNGGCGSGSKEVMVEDPPLTEEEKARLAPMLEQMGGTPDQMIRRHTGANPGGAAPAGQ